MTRLIIPVAGVIQKSGLPMKLGFHLLDARHGEVMRILEQGRTWSRDGGVAWQLSVMRPHRPRSTGRGSQSAHYHGHIATIAEATGADVEAVAMAIKTEAISGGYPYKIVRGRMWPISEADASVEDSIVLIETCHRIAAEYNIVLTEEAT